VKSLECDFASLGLCLEKRTANLFTTASKMVKVFSLPILRSLTLYILTFSSATEVWAIEKDEASVFEHPTLGSMTGVISPETPDVIRFRAIPYATLPGRFKKSVLRKNFDGLRRNFTKPGYACPQTLDRAEIHGGGPYPGEDPIQMNEFECLILEVNVPRSHLESLQKGNVKQLPVMTYIHGGGFATGKIDAAHNTAFMVQHSLTVSKPVIMAAVQYRLGALGFMATPEGEKNLGLWDQRNSLLWIQEFIAGFGGNKERITLFGESAGGYSISSHMLSRQPSSGPLFNRVILESGVPGPMAGPVSEAVAGTVFTKISKGLGIKEQGEAALSKLQDLDVHALVLASDAWISAGNSWQLVDDTSFFNTNFTWNKVPELLSGCEWVDEIILGDTAFEGLAYANIANTFTPNIFFGYLTLQAGIEDANKVMEAYNVRLGMDQNLFLTSAMRFNGDLLFDGEYIKPTLPHSQNTHFRNIVSVHRFAQHAATKSDKRIYRYIFDVRNPFPNSPYYQQAHHWVDVYFLFRTMQFRFPYQYLKDISDKHAALWIGFANGEKPWGKYEGSKESVIIVADEREGWVEKTLPEYEKLSGVRFGRLDTLWEAWSAKEGQ
jgi:carboxylesterase type B